MAGYSVFIKPSAVREIDSIPQKKQRERIIAPLRSLGREPRPQGCENLSGQSRYRIRQGAYRIVYSIEDEALVVYVVKVGQRGSVYR